MADRLFRLLLRLLPEEFRASYGQDMAAAFRAERAGARASGRRGARARLWVATAGDVLRQAPREHLAVLRRDLQFAWRLMAARPAQTVTAILTLAIAIGANVATFAVVDAVLLAPLPYPNADRLVMIRETEAGDDGRNLGYLTFVDLRGRARAFETMAAAGGSSATLTGSGRDAERVNAMRVSRTYFDLIGVQPALGRAFLEEEDRPGVARRVTILSDALWRRRFDADPAVVGRPIDIAGIPYVVVGVMPAGFRDLVAERMYDDAELWTPLGYDPTASFACRTCRHLRVFGRLDARATRQSAERELAGIIAGLEREHPTQYHQAGLVVTSLSDVILGPIRLVLFVLAAAVGVLLVVACGHVANLLLLRASERSHEWAVRAALGVTRRRFVRQLLTESLLLSATAAAIGLALAATGVSFVRASGLSDLPRLASASIDLRAAGVAIGVATMSGLLFGLLPVRRLSGAQGAALAAGQRRSTASAGVWRTRSALVSANVAMATLLLVGSGLLVRSLMGLLAVAPGVDPAGVLTMQLWASGARFNAGETSDQIAVAVSYYDEVLGRLRALPGVTAVGAVTTLPLGGGVDGYGLHVDGRFESNPQAAPSADRFVIAGDFFDALRVPLKRGRTIGAGDRQDTEHVVVINETMARRLFPGEDPIGQRVRLGPQTADPRVIIGIVGDVQHHGLDEPVGYQVYVPQAQWAWAESWLTLLVRSSGDPSALVAPIRAAIRGIDAAQPVTAVRLYAEVIEATTRTRAFAARLVTLFAATALLLSAIGLYGALAVRIGQREREIGIRVALGAPTRAVRGMVLGQGLVPVGIGLVSGVLVAALAGSSLGALLYGVPGHDPATIAWAVLLVVVSGFGACLPLALRAGRVDPVVALRAE